MNTKKITKSMKRTNKKVVKATKKNPEKALVISGLSGIAIGFGATKLAGKINKKENHVNRNNNPEPNNDKKRFLSKLNPKNWGNKNKNNDDQQNAENNVLSTQEDGSTPDPDSES